MKEKRLFVTDELRKKWAPVTTNDVEIVKLEKLRNIESHTKSTKDYIGVLLLLVLVSTVLNACNALL